MKGGLICLFVLLSASPLIVVIVCAFGCCCVGFKQGHKRDCVQPGRIHVAANRSFSLVSSPVTITQPSVAAQGRTTSSTTTTSLVTSFGVDSPRQPTPSFPAVDRPVSSTVASTPVSTTSTSGTTTQPLAATAAVAAAAAVHAASSNPLRAAAAAAASREQFGNATSPSSNPSVSVASSSTIPTTTINSNNNNNNNNNGGTTAATGTISRASVAMLRQSRAHIRADHQSGTEAARRDSERRVKDRQAHVSRLMMSLPVFQAPANIAEDRCAVCLDRMADAPVTMGACMHVVHVHCLTAWISKITTDCCPLCRSDIAIRS